MEHNFNQTVTILKKGRTEELPMMIHTVKEYICQEVYNDIINKYFYKNFYEHEMNTNRQPTFSNNKTKLLPTKLVKWL